MPLEPTRVFRAFVLATVAMMLLCWNVAYGQTRNSGLWRELPKPQSCPKRSRMLERAVTIWAESNQEWLYDYEFSPNAESILALSRKSATGTKTDWQFRILKWSRAGQEPEVVLAFNSDAERIAVSPDGHIAVSRIERRKTDSERSFRDGNKGWEAFSIAEIYEAGSDQPVKTLEFNFSGAHQSLHYSGNGRWLSFGPVVYSTADWQAAWTRSGDRRSPNRWSLHPTLDRMVYATPSFVDWTSGTNPSVTVFDLERKEIVKQEMDSLREQLRQIAIYKDAVDVLAWRPDGSGILMANGRTFIDAAMHDIPAAVRDERFSRAMIGRLDSVTQLGATSDGAWTIVGYGDSSPERVIFLNPKQTLGYFIDGRSFRIHPKKPEVLIHQRIYPSTNGASLTRELLLIVDLNKLAATK